VICWDAVLSEQRSIFTFLYEGMMSREVREDFLKGGGFCPNHFRLAEQIEKESWPAGGIGIAILCEQLVAQARAGIDVVARMPNRTTRWQLKRKQPVDVFVAGSGCIFCRENREREEGRVRVLEELIEDEDFSRSLSSKGLCVRHAQMALRLWKDPGKRQWLQRIVRQQLAELEADLREFIEKHDYQRRREPLGRENCAVSKAMNLLVGAVSASPLKMTK
jgi:hypothetical protein